MVRWRWRVHCVRAHTHGRKQRKGATRGVRSFVGVGPACSIEGGEESWTWPGRRGPRAGGGGEIEMSSDVPSVRGGTEGKGVVAGLPGQTSFDLACALL